MQKLMNPELLKSLIDLFVRTYNNITDIEEKLLFTYDFIDFCGIDTLEAHQILQQLLIYFNDERFHLSELKALLVISKPVKDLPMISEVRLNLLNTYNLKKEVSKVHKN